MAIPPTRAVEPGRVRRVKVAKPATACTQGQSLSAAAGAALDKDPNADIASMLAQLLGAGALTRPGVKARGNT